MISSICIQGIATYPKDAETRNVRGWLGPGGAGRVQSSPQFAYLEGQNVRFMDLNPSVSPPSLGGGGGSGGGY